MQTRVLALVAGAALLIACGGSKSGGSSGSSGSSGTTSGTCTAANAATGQCACNADTDCPTGYTCDTEQTKTCIFQCQNASDCTADYAPPDTKTTCQNSALGCTCDFDPSSGLAVCSTKGCGTDSDCPASGVCQNGQCQGDPTTQVASCTVTPEYQVLNAGQAFTFTAQAYADTLKTKPLRVPAASVTWTVAGGAPMTNSGATFTVNTGATATEVAGVQASIHGQTCTAKVKIYPTATAYRVVVIDALAGVPISGATVMVDSTTATTDQDGIASPSGITAGTHTVSVFNPGFDYVTVVGTSSTDLLIPITRNGDANQGGVTGTVQNLFQANSKIHAGFVGMSIAGSITDLSTTVLIGPEQALCDNPAGCSVGGKTLPADIKVPSGVMLGLNDQTFKEHYTALGSAGYCDDATKTANGTCGTRGIWGLAGDIDIDKISPVIDQVSGGGGLSNINIGGVLTSLLPVLRDFNSLAVRDQAITLGPVGSDGNPTSSNLAAYNFDLTKTDGSSVRLGLKMTVKVPALPKDPDDSNKWVDGALVLGASDVPGRGLFPLGLTAGVDNTGTQAQPVVDGHVSYTDSVGAEHKDQVELNMAPNHNGTESGTYRMAILASSFSNLTNGLVGTGIVVNPGACSAANNNNGICYGGNITYSSEFMGFPASATMDYAGRLLTPNATSLAGATMMRADFHDGAEHRWFVYFDPAAAQVQIPAAPSGFEDRIFTDSSGATRSTLLLLAFDLGSAHLDDAATFGSQAASFWKLDRFIQRFAIKDYPPPSISISSPSDNATGFSKSGGQVTVDIAGDGASPTWVLCSTSSTAAITAGDLASCQAGGTVNAQGSASATVPTNAPTSGTTVLHAVLTTSNGTLLNPSVEDKVTVTMAP